ncbi:MAG: hypothetical protein IPO66_09080 [Rhodanobacteraceae bacterium]|nr:hypothetical protein [Rhodanobacteraceae bacterium]
MPAGWPAMLIGGPCCCLWPSVASGSGVKSAMLVWFAPMLSASGPEFAKELCGVAQLTLAPLLPLAVAAVILRGLAPPGSSALARQRCHPPTSTPPISAPQPGCRAPSPARLADWPNGCRSCFTSCPRAAFDDALVALQPQRPAPSAARRAWCCCPTRTGAALELVFTVVGIGLLLRHPVPAAQRTATDRLAASYIGMLTALLSATASGDPDAAAQPDRRVFLAAPNPQLEFTRAIVAALRWLRCCRRWRSLRCCCCWSGRCIPPSSACRCWPAASSARSPPAWRAWAWC